MCYYMKMHNKRLSDCCRSKFSGKGFNIQEIVSGLTGEHYKKRNGKINMIVVGRLKRSCLHLSDVHPILIGKDGNIAILGSSV